MTPGPTTMTEQTPSARLDPRMRTAIAGVASFGAMFAIGGAVGWGARTGLSVAAGATVAVLNLYGLAKILGALVGGRAEGDEASGMWGMFAVVKVFALFGGVWLLMTTNLVDPLPLVVGWGALPVGIAIASLMSDRGARQRDRSGTSGTSGTRAPKDLSDKSDRSSAPRAKEAPPLPRDGSHEGSGEE